MSNYQSELELQIGLSLSLSLSPTPKTEDFGHTHGNCENAIPHVKAFSVHFWLS